MPKGTIHEMYMNLTVEFLPGRSPDVACQYMNSAHPSQKVAAMTSVGSSSTRRRSALRTACAVPRTTPRTSSKLAGKAATNSRRLTQSLDSTPFWAPEKYRSWSPQVSEYRRVQKLLFFVGTLLGSLPTSARLGTLSSSFQYTEV